MLIPIATRGFVKYLDFYLQELRDTLHAVTLKLPIEATTPKPRRCLPLLHCWEHSRPHRRRRSRSWNSMVESRSWWMWAGTIRLIPWTWWNWRSELLAFVWACWVLSQSTSSSNNTIFSLDMYRRCRLSYLLTRLLRTSVLMPTAARPSPSLLKSPSTPLVLLYRLVVRSYRICTLRPRWPLPSSRKPPLPNLVLLRQQPLQHHLRVMAKRIRSQVVLVASCFNRLPQRISRDTSL